MRDSLNEDAIRLDVNGTVHHVRVDPLRRLSDVLRLDLRLPGTKVGCEAGDCGACTVLLGDRTVCACLTPAAQAQAAPVRTVEGLSSTPLGRRLQDSFVAFGAAQCGICTPGVLMAAIALLEEVASPTRAQIEDALGGVLCRCTGYQKIVEAIASLSHPSEAHEPQDEFAVVGRRVARVDGPGKVNGTEAFGDDIAPDGALWVKVIRSPYAHAKFRLPDADKLIGKLGVSAVLTAKDVPGINSYSVFPDFRDQPVFAEEVARFRGEAVMGLVGAREVLLAITDDEVGIQWEELVPILRVDEALASTTDLIHPHRPRNVLTKGHIRRGNCDAVESAARASIEVRTSFVEHAYIEPEAGFATCEGDGTVTISGCTQSPYMDRMEMARILGLPEESVRIVPTACGGGFGGKLDLSFQPFAALGAIKTGRPVRCVYSRGESMVATPKRHPGTMKASLRMSGTGHFQAYEFHGDFDTGAYASFGPTVSSRVPTHACGPYVIPNLDVFAQTVHTNNPPSGAFRGFGVPQATIVLESLIDDCAMQLGLDPLDVRCTNALRRGSTLATGQRLDTGVGILQCLEALRPAWTQARHRIEQQNERAAREGSPFRHGVGLSSAIYGTGAIGSNPSTIRIALSRSGRFKLFSGAVDMGQGATTVILQIAAEALGLAVADFGLVLWDTRLTPDAGKSSASRQTFISGKAAHMAAGQLRRSILERLDMAPGAQLSLKGSTLTARGAGRQAQIDLAGLEGDYPFDESATFDPPTDRLNAEYQGNFFASWGMGALLAEVRVDVELGTVKVVDLEGAFDVGRAINPTLVEGQVQGGVAQGLGMALMEEYLPGRTDNLHDYLIPTIGDVPTMRVHLIGDPAPIGPYGAKGAGEIPVIPAAPAIFNAIRHACGVRVVHAPVTPSRLLAAIQAKAGEEQFEARR